MIGALVAAGGLVLGLWLLGRGLFAYLRAQRISGIASSPVASIAVGEVRVAGTVEPDVALLVSPLASEKCVWYRARVEESSSQSSRTVFAESRAVGFRVKDASGAIRVFPRGAAFTAPDDLHGSDDAFGSSPDGLRLNTGPTLIGVIDDDREAQVRELLTVRDAGASAGVALDGRGPVDRFGIGFPVLGIDIGAATSRRRYAEARIAPGDAVTVIGWALPFGALDDPIGADTSATADSVVPPDDPALVADLAEARAAGTLADSPAEAWGNAAIPGFGIGRPVRPPELDPEAKPLPAGDADLAARAERRFEIREDELVLAAGDGMSLAVYDGEPAVAAGREQDRFVVGLLGAAIAIACAVILAYLIRGGALS